ncbi:efflux RND transporter permease subunit [Dyella koreensis]|uniref:Efflux RND transporter permease subunit n=1 Tax=Dyella koreensis TaxID=311235 RepID=A0ABW8K803_9GAMM
MIDKLIAWCLHKRALVFGIAILVMIYGHYAWTQLAVEAYPDLSDVTAQVTTQVPGLAAQEIEQQITIPLERALAGTPGLVSMRSSSTFGLSLITLVFRDGAEDYWSRQRVMERIAGVTLPAGVTPALDPVSGPVGEIYRYTLESDTRNLMELSEIQRWKVIPALQQVSGVANVDNFGGFTKEFQLEVDPQKLLQYGVGMNDVITAISANNTNAGGGRVTRGEQSYVIRSEGLMRSLKDMGDIVVTQHNGNPIRVRDLGKLQYGHQIREGILGKNGNPDTIQGVVDLLKYENPSKVLTGIHAKVDALNQQLAAQDVRIVPHIDRGDLVQATVSKVSHTVIEGVALVCFVLILFLGSPRSALVAAVTIPFALVTVFIVMHFFKMPANLFSLGAIDFGVIVDGAIVVTEAILRKREARPDAYLHETDVLSATKQVARPIFFATLIIITAYAPLLAFQRAEGKLFSPMAYTVGYALLGALLCAITLVPALAWLALRQPRKMLHNKPLERLQAAYRRALERLLDRRRIIYTVAGIALAAVIALGASIGREFLPELDEGSLWLQVQLPSGLSLEKASEMASEYRRVVGEFPEVSHVVTQLGRNGTGTDPWTPSHIESSVGLKPYDAWPSGESKADFVRRLHARLQQIPGISASISQPIIDNQNDLLGGAHSPLVLRIYGDDYQELRRIGGAIVDALKTVRGTADASLFQGPPSPQLTVTVDRDAAARYGINVADINTLIQTGVGGSAVTRAYVEDRVYNVTARLSPQVTAQPETLGQLTLTSPSGARVPLAMVTKITLQTAESTIAHQGGKRQLTVRVANRDRALSEYLADAQDTIGKAVHFDAQQYHLEWAGQFENQQRAQARLVLVMGLVLAMMAVLLFAEFGNLRQALLVLAVVPLAALGGLISLHLKGETLNIATAVGFIALFGVAVQNGIIMVANFNRMRREGHGVRDAVLLGATERFRPVLMTATVASVGMLPAALATGIGTDVQRGLATVVVGGLVIATLLTLFILPALYDALEHVVERRRRCHSQPAKEI